MLSKWELTRYSRNILLPEVGKKGQEKLKSARVGVVGAGGLGSPILYYLAACGIGKIQFLDSDKVDLTNLQRQILYSSGDVGLAKAVCAKNVLSNLNPNLELEGLETRLTAENIQEIFSNLDFILEGSDNFATKFLVNDFCVLNKIPFVIGGILGFEGQILVAVPHKTACYRCIFQDLPPQDAVPTCSEAGVIGSVAGVVGSTMATLAINYLLGIEELTQGFLLSFDFKDFSFRKIPLKKNPSCKVCGENPTIQKIESKNYPSVEVCV